MFNKNIEQSFNMDYDYDYQNDSLFLYITDDYGYKQSLRLDEDIILDFDQLKCNQKKNCPCQFYCQVMP
jgi:hypothetical protein